MLDINHLTKAIENGKKIVVDEKNLLIKIIKGVCIKNSDEIIYDEVKVSSTEIKNLQKNYKYSPALYNPVERGIILIDVANYSKGDNLYQAAILNILNTAIKNSFFRISRSQRTRKRVFESIVSTGDGYYIIFNEDLNQTFFRTAISFISEIYSVQQDIFKSFGRYISKCEMVHIRISCTLNDVDFFEDAIGARNCYGKGLNEAERILSCGRNEIEKKQKIDTSDTIFFDETLHEQAKSFINGLNKFSTLVNAEIVPLNLLEDKHGKERLVWWVKNLPKPFPFDLWSLDKFF